MILNCIEQDLRYDYTTALFALQSNWVKQDTKESERELFKIMQSGGMKKDQFEKCINDIELEKIGASVQINKK